MNGDSLQPFFDRFATVNPFVENRVNGPVLASWDVSEVNRSAFDRLTTLASEALRIRRGLGVVLWGEAGVGKSHLLGRLGHWAEGGKAHLVYLHNLQASPEALPRSFLRSVVTVLTGGRRDQFQRTALYELVRAGLKEACSGASQVGPNQLERLFRRWLSNLGPAASEPVAWEVLLAFFRSAYQHMHGREDGRIASLAVRWLSGGALDPDEAQQLGLPPARQRGEPVVLEDAQEIKQVLVALTRLAASQERPFILAIDQVDNLDSDQFAALSRFLEALLDTACNLLVITAGIQATLREWRETRAVQASAWDRIAQFDVLLTRLPCAQAEQMLRRRIDDFMAPFVHLEPVRQLQQAAALFPLSEKWAVEQIRQRIDIRPRDVFSLAREAWHIEQVRLKRMTGPVWLRDWPGEGEPPGVLPPLEERIDREVEQELQKYRDRLLADLAQLPSDADRLADVLAALLEQCLGPARGMGVVEVRRLSSPRHDVRPTYHLWLRRQIGSREQVTGLLALVVESKTSAAAYFRRLAQDRQPVDRVVVVTEERVRTSLAGKGEEYRNALRQREAVQLVELELTVTELVELEALRGVVLRARAGDVELFAAGKSQKITPEEVIASHHRRGRYRAHRLLQELLRPESSGE